MEGREGQKEGEKKQHSWNLTGASCVFLSTAAKYGEHESTFSSAFTDLGPPLAVSATPMFSGSFHSVRNLPMEEKRKKETSEDCISPERASGTCGWKNSEIKIALRLEQHQKIAQLLIFQM